MNKVRCKQVPTLIFLPFHGEVCIGKAPVLGQEYWARIKDADTLLYDEDNPLALPICVVPGFYAHLNFETTEGMEP